jgi:hypothetical protein
MSDIINALHYLVVTSKGENHLGNIEVDGKILLKLTLKEQGRGVRTWFIWLQYRIQSDSCEYVNEPSGSTKAQTFLHQLSKSLLPKESDPSSLK